MAVVGGGIAGLAAAWELTGGGEVAGEVGGKVGPEVHLLESGDRLGGSLRSARFAGRQVDLAADAFLARRPEATELCAELGLSEQLVPVGASGASVWARGRVRPMPRGLNLGVPTRWWPLLRSGIVSPGEAIRVARDLVQPHFGAGGIAGDRAVGAIVEARLGRPVVDRLVDPLVGGINAGNADDLSAAATFPFLLAASLQPGSLMRRLGQAGRTRAVAPAGGSPVFWSLPTGTAGLADRLAGELGRRGVTCRTGVPVEAIRREAGSGSGRWLLDLGTHPVHSLAVDGVVLAVPAGEAAVLLAAHAPEAAGLLSTIEYASVAVLTLSLPPGAIRSPLHGTGLLVPRTATVDGVSPLVTAVTYLGRKWPHLAREDDELVRVSVGRFGDARHRDLDDDQLLRTILDDLARLLEVRDPPVESMVTRWDGSFPQYRVGHLLRVGRVEQEVAALGGVAVAGAAYRGVGIPACIGGGRDAGRRVLGFLASRPEGVRPPAGEGGPA